MITKLEKIRRISMLVSVLLFAVGLVLLIKGGDWFVDGATGIAKRFNLPDIVVGATVVSIGTTLPEVMVSTTGALAGSGAMAYGNAIGSIICNIDLNEMINAHVNSGADMTFAVKKVDLTEEDAAKNVVFESDNDGNITDVLSFRSRGISGPRDVNLNIFVANTSYIQRVVNDALAHGFKSFHQDVIAPNLKKDKLMVYRYDGYFANIGSVANFFSHNMELISKPEIREELFNTKNRPIYTKVRNSAPTKYGEGAVVKNSLIADGCVIDGEVENSILFRGAKVGKGTKIKNSILFQDTFTGENVFLNCVITDKNVVIRDDRILSGHESMPFFIEKGKMI